MAHREALGATPLPDGSCRFVVWAPRCDRVQVHLVAPEERTVDLVRGERGYHRATVPGVRPGARYLVCLDPDQEHVRKRPDPASRSQPEGVHAPSEVVDLDALAWTDAGWHGRSLREYVIYELHVGTFTREGTFDAAIAHLERLRDLGVTAIEVMPIASFPGERNWGYDGVALFAAQQSYGGPAGLARFVDACHARDLAVVLDVVYNHLGPEGNYLGEFGPYFTAVYHTPWGQALNFDGAESDDVRRFFVDNALQWVEAFHVDALRLDAVHAIVDRSPRPFLEELAGEVHRAAERAGRIVHLIAESDANDPRLVRPPEVGGYGLDAVWADDLHHAIHASLTGETHGYYEDYGGVDVLARALRNGFAFAGDYSPFRKRRHGRPASDVPPERFVVCSQNHDQVGNRLRGDRLTTIAGLEAQKLAAGIVTLAPGIPLIFMGEEYGETAPFAYFTSHTDPELARNVREGRKKEFAWAGYSEEPPDPQAVETFERSKLDHALRDEGAHRGVMALYRELLALRRSHPALVHRRRDRVEVLALERHDVLYVRSDASDGGGSIAMTFNLDAAPQRIALPLPRGAWSVCLDSSDPRFGGHGPTATGEVDSDGEHTLDVAGHGFIVLARKT